LQVFQLLNVPTHQPLSCQLVQQFPGGSTHRLLSRSCLFLRPESEDKLFAAYGNEGTKTVSARDIAVNGNPWQDQTVEKN
jgi:hypothetical protein